MSGVMTTEIVAESWTCAYLHDLKSRWEAFMLWLLFVEHSRAAGGAVEALADSGPKQSL